MMQNFVAVVVVAVVVASTFASCKKDYTCECTYGGAVIGTIKYKDTKKKAKDACEASNSTYNSYGSGVSCSIK